MKKYIVYKYLDKRCGGEVFNCPRKALYWAVENLFMFTFYRLNGESWEDTFIGDLGDIDKGVIA